MQGNIKYMSNDSLYEEIMEKSGQDASKDDDLTLFGELAYLAKSLAVMVIVGPILILVISGGWTYLSTGSFTNFVDITTAISGYTFMFAGLYVVLSFYTGKSVYMAHALRAAWTNKESDTVEMKKDFDAFAYAGTVITTLLVGSIVTLFISLFVLQ